MVIQPQTPGGVLQEASKSGKLDEALELLRQEQNEVMQAAPQEQKWMGQFWRKRRWSLSFLSHGSC